MKQRRLSVSLFIHDLSFKIIIIGSKVAIFNRRSLENTQITNKRVNKFGALTLITMIYPCMTLKVKDIILKKKHLELETHILKDRKKNGNTKLGHLINGIGDAPRTKHFESGSHYSKGKKTNEAERIV